MDSYVSRMVEVLRVGCCLSSKKDRILCSGDTEELQLIQGKGINFLRAFPRPFWAIISALIFGFSAFTYVYSWWLQALHVINVAPIALPWMLFAIIAQVVTFYFGSRFFEKKNGSADGKSFLDRLDNNL